MRGPGRRLFGTEVEPLLAADKEGELEAKTIPDETVCAEGRACSSPDSYMVLTQRLP
ncbi:hypothetical protein [Sorangium sp. So ce861]|uniref:hypothetical protein n=1 Tax=Sorangium sp. So ce861 TaxID=3133323 RepID=UPI003F5FB470